mmetsp:Transcript_48874/g.111336  ORF Transcript_48874/g.111336 Transcript_48874/m.111336 type:complete len:278 (-) Transcript_48874:114-947(-)
MRRVPILGHQGTQRREHHCLELRQVDIAFVLGNTQGEDVALFLQAVGIRDIRHNGVKGGQDLIHPSIPSEAHYSGVEEEHLVESGWHRGVLEVAIIRGPRAGSPVLPSRTLALGAVAHHPSPNVRFVLLVHLGLLAFLFRLLLGSFVLLLGLHRPHQVICLVLLFFLPILALCFFCCLVLLKLLKFRLLVVGRGPARGQNLQAVSVLQADIDVGTSGVVEHLKEAILGYLREAGAEFTLQEIQDGVPEDHDSGHCDLEIQVLEAQRLDNDLHVFGIL